MAILNRRNAVLGWTVWQIAKRVAKRKAKEAVPSIDADKRRPNKSLVFVLVGALVGLAWLWLRGGEDGGSDI
jgi:hypothetical protein